MSESGRYPINEWPENERPRERLIKIGAASLSDAHLLAIILRVGDSSSGMNAIDLAMHLLEKSGNMVNLEQFSIAELCSVSGLGNAKAAQLKAAFEIGRRIMAGGERPSGIIGGSKDVAAYYLPILKNVKKEIFRVLLLTTKNQIIRESIVSKGSLNASIVHPREVFSSAIRYSAASIIMIHNHPSGNPVPSREDKVLTKRLTECGEIMGIKVLDHVIIGEIDYFSFLDEELI